MCNTCMYLQLFREMFPEGGPIDRSTDGFQSLKVKIRL